jgi:hypothetical protein
MPCAPGTAFNPVLFVCDWPSADGCALAGGSTTPNVIVGGGEGTTAAPVGTCPDGASTDPYPDPDDCSKFYQCSNGLKYRKNCPAGTAFNPILKVCDWTAVAGCGVCKCTKSETEIFANRFLF